MKQFLYLLTLFASVGTIGVVATNPQLVQQGASFLGLEQETPQRSTPPAETGDDHLAKFLSNYPYAKQNNVDPPSPSIVEPAPDPRAERRPPALIPDTPTSASLPFFASPPTSPPAPAPNSASPPSPGPTPPIPPMLPIAVDPVPHAAPFDPGVQTAKADPSDTHPAFSNEVGMATTRRTPPPNTNFDDPPAGFATTGRFPSGSSGGLIGSLDQWSEPPAVPPTVQRIMPPPEPAEPNNRLADQPIRPFGEPAFETSPAPASFQESPFQVAAIPVDPTPPPAPSQPPPQPNPVSQFQINPSVLAEEVPCHGTEMVARVGTEVILMCDVLPQLRRHALHTLKENIRLLPQEEQEKIAEEEKETFVETFIAMQYPMLLQDQINVALIYNDFTMTTAREQIEFFEKKLGEDFERARIPELIKEFGVKDQAELKQFLKNRLGSSLDRERMLWIRTNVAQQWLGHSVQTAEGECTYDEMMEYYTNHRDEFESKPKARWRELTVSFSNFKTEREAWDKIAWMGNQVAAGAPFEEIAKANSDGFTASKGGEWDWTGPGSLASPDIEKAVFSLPVGKLSPSITRSDKGFHIVEVLERREAVLTPFVDAQVLIREKIRMQRRQKHNDEYFAELKRKYPTIVLRESIDFKTAVRPDEPRR